MTQVHQIFWLNHMQMYIFKHGDDELDHSIDLSHAVQGTGASITEVSRAQRLKSCLLDVRKAQLRATQVSNSWPGTSGGSRQAEEPWCCLFLALGTGLERLIHLSGQSLTWVAGGLLDRYCTVPRVTVSL